MDGFEGLLRQRIAEGFHDAPEAIKVKQRAGEPQIRVQVDQWDAPILATEAFMILEAIVLFLRMRG